MNATRVSMLRPSGFVETDVNGHTTVVDKPLAEAIAEYVAAGEHWTSAQDDAKATEKAASERLSLADDAMKSELTRYDGRLILRDGIVYGDHKLMGNASPGAPGILLVDGDEPTEAACQCGREQDAGDDEPETGDPVELDCPELTSLLEKRAKLLADDDVSNEAVQRVETAIDALIDRRAVPTVLFRGQPYGIDGGLMDAIYAKATDEQETDDADAQEAARANRMNIYAAAGMPLEHAEAEAIAGTEIDDAELAFAIREQIEAYEDLRIARKAERAAEARQERAECNLDRLLQKYPSRVVLFDGRVYTVNHKLLGNSYPSGAPIVHLKAPSSAQRANGVTV